MAACKINVFKAISIRTPAPAPTPKLLGNTVGKTVIENKFPFVCVSILLIPVNKVVLALITAPAVSSIRQLKLG